MKQVILNTFVLNINGLHLNYTSNGQTYIVKLDPCATCDLLKNAGLIEGFDIDANGEPVILFTDTTYPQGYGFEFWALFVCFFPFTHRHAEMVAEYREENKQFRKSEAIIRYLLQPLQAA